MGALAYLEFRYALHRASAILHAPLRLAVWAPYIFFVVYFGFARFVHHHAGQPAFNLIPTFETTIAGGYLALVGSTMALAAGGRVGAFRSPAEAVLFSNARVRPLTIALWLQLRKIAASPARWLGGFIYLFAIAAPKDTSPFALVRAIVVVGMLVALAMGIELPAFLLGRGRARGALRAAGWTIAAIGGIYALAGLLGKRVLDPMNAYVPADPGPAVRALFDGDPMSIAGIALLLAGLAASVAVLGDDAMPELYAASLGVRTIRTRRKRVDRNYVAAQETKETNVPRGALALVWKDWMAFRRGRGALRLWLVGLGAWTACGVAMGVAKVHWNDSTPIVTLVCGSVMLAMVLAPFNASLGLASDLSKSLFWLNAAPLRTCIAAWTAARSWRGGIMLGIAPAAAGLYIGDATLATMSLPLALAAYWSLQSLGVGLYAAFPDPIDTRGPMLLVRLIITALYVAPAAIACGLISILSGLYPLAIGAAAAMLLMQGYGVVELAAYRFREFGASLATLSRAT